MTAIIYLPETVYCNIFAFLKDEPNFAILRLVCKSFNYYVCKSMFETIVVYASSGEPPTDRLKWLATKNGFKTSGIECAQLVHLLNGLDTQWLPIAMQHARHLKIFVSDLFRLNGQSTGRSIKFTASLERDARKAIQCLTVMLPGIIRNLGNLEEATLYLSSYEPEDFIKSVSGALLSLPRLGTLNINFLDSQSHRALQVINAQCLESLVLSWPVSGSDFVPSSGRDQPSIYHTILELGVRGSNLKRLEISARYRQQFGTGQCKLPPLPQVEELVLENVPIVLTGEVVLGMPHLQGLSLGGFDCFNCDPYAAIWSSLRKVGRGLKAVGVDVVGQALVDYLASYEGLEILVLKLDEHANDYCAKDLCEWVIQCHTHSLRSLHIDLHHDADFRVTWFFEYWIQWIPEFSNLRTLKVTTSMNLRSEFDAEVLLNGIIKVVTGIPTLQRLLIRHKHEEDYKDAEIVFADSVIEYDVKAIRKPLPLAPSCLVVIEKFQRSFRVMLDRKEGLFGFLRIIEHEE